MKPLIGITTYLVTDEELNDRRVRGTKGQDMIMSNLDYSRSVDEVGGIPVALPVLDDPRTAEGMIQHLDGLLLAGGEDIDPPLFGQETRPGLGTVSRKRDLFEFALVKTALEKRVPILGICRGFQLLNVYFGGTLHQDLASYFNSSVPHASAALGRDSLVHEVTIKDGTYLKDCYGTKTIRVNSLHHQGVDILAPDLIPTAASSDGLVEGFQHRAVRYVFGVQWHPEMLTERYKIHQNVFRFFVGKAGEKGLGSDADL
jgi:putative glutamine amidotransferase